MSIEYSYFVAQSLSHYSTVKEGTALIKERDLNLFEFTDERSDVSAIFAVDSHNGFTDILVGGLKADFQVERGIFTNSIISQIPKGRFRYDGTTIITPRLGGRFINASGEFTMNVNFDNSSGNINARTSTKNFYSELTGLFEIDIDTGTFSNSLMEFRIFDDQNFQTQIGLTKSATIYGAFHNEDISGVSGIYYDNHSGFEENLYAGAIIGAGKSQGP